MRQSVVDGKFVGRVLCLFSSGNLIFARDAIRPLIWAIPLCATKLREAPVHANPVIDLNQGRRSRVLEMCKRKTCCI